MDFFEAQDRAKRKTTKLIVLYALAVILMITAIYLIVTALFNPGGHLPASAGFADRFWHPQLLLVVSTFVIILILAGSLFRIAQLKRGGSAVAEMLGGRKVEPSTSDSSEQQLMNIVEEMSIASGVPVPDVYVMDREEAINAFAAGFGTSDAAIGVTRGALDQLSRDELQGVIAHEYSHIFNGDMRLNIRLIGILNGILLLHIMGLLLMRSGAWSGAMRGGGGRGGGQGGGQAAIVIILLGLSLLVIGYIGMLFGRMIQAAVSRQREYLADAAAVQYTRNPDGLAGALRKIGQKKQGGRIEDGHAMEMSHLFFASSFHSALDRIFATHPPIEKRIKAIAPAHDREHETMKERVQNRLDKDRIAQADRTESGQPSKGAFGPITGHDALTPEVILAAIGTIDGQRVNQAGKLLSQIPSPLRRAAHEPLSAEALIYAILLSYRQKRRDTSGDSDDLPDTNSETGTPGWLIEQAGSDITSHLDPLLTSLQGAEQRWFLPLAELALPTLRSMSRGQYQTFRSIIERLGEEIDRNSLFLFTLEKMIVRHLDKTFSKSKEPKVRHHHLKTLGQELSILLSTLAYASDSAPEEAFRAGMTPIEKWAPEGVSLLPKGDCEFAKLGPALDEFAVSANPVKKAVLSAVIHSILANENISFREQELLRALSETIDVPMPIDLLMVGRS